MEASIPQAPTVSRAQYFQELYENYSTPGEIKYHLGRDLLKRPCVSFALPIDELFMHTMFQLKGPIHRKLVRTYSDEPQSATTIVPLSPSLCNLIFGSEK